MSYKINWGISDGVFAVPDYVANTLLKNMSPVTAKVLLYIFSNKNALSLSPSEIAAVAGKGVTKEDVEDAISDMELVGILYKNGDTPMVYEETANINTIAVSTVNEVTQTPAIISAEKAKERSTKMFTPAEISERINSNGELAFLFSASEEMLGRILNHTEHRTLLWLYDYYGLKADVVLMIIDYCKSIDKTNIGYIEKIAVSFHDNNITTHELAEREIARLQNYYSYEGKIKSHLGLNRTLISKEKEFISEWSLLGVDIELVILAYEKTIISTGKLSFSYMNKIITEWHKNGIRTVSDAENASNAYSASAKKNGKNNSKSNSSSNEHSYDLNKILEYSMNNIPDFKE